MSRKPTKGYFVRGHFVALGSELDQELKRELKGDVELSKTDLKKESARLQALGENLLTLRAELMQRLNLPEKLQDALAEARRITNFEGRRRQMQYIGKLMRALDEEQLTAAQAALDEQNLGSAQATLSLHQAEQWRDRLLADGDQALADLLDAFPTADRQKLRQLARNAVDEKAKNKPPRAFRELFRELRELLLSSDARDAEEDDAH